VRPNYRLELTARLFLAERPQLKRSVRWQKIYFIKGYFMSYSIGIRILFAATLIACHFHRTFVWALDNKVNPSFDLSNPGSADNIVMSEKKASFYCDLVANRISDGTIINNMMDNQFKYMKYTYNYFGKSRTLKYIVSGGSCSNWDIVDMNADPSTYYPEYDDEDLRWASWGHIDHLVLIEGEPIIITGTFGGGESRATLISWIAPSGGKQPLCLLAPTTDVKIKININEDVGLCQSIIDGSSKSAIWKEGHENKIVNSGKIDKSTLIDINMDGLKDNIGFLSFDSGAGCGAKYEWLSVLAEDGTSVVKSELNEVLFKKARGPIPNAGESKLNIVFHKERPYIVTNYIESGQEYPNNRNAKLPLRSQSVISIWGNKTKVWCEYGIFPKHIVTRYINMK
jgi:hypothetical protein